MRFFVASVVLVAGIGCTSPEEECNEARVEAHDRWVRFATTLRESADDLGPPEEAQQQIASHQALSRTQQSFSSLARGVSHREYDDGSHLNRRTANRVRRELEPIDNFLGEVRFVPTRNQVDNWDRAMRDIRSARSCLSELQALYTNEGPDPSGIGAPMGPCRATRQRIGRSSGGSGRRSATPG
jgi:hypothetical protein